MDKFSTSNKILHHLNPAHDKGRINFVENALGDQKDKQRLVK